MSAATLRITEIFFSLQGESSFVGLPTTFIRLTGCPLRCHYCDSAYAFTGGQTLSIHDILEQVSNTSCRYVTVTGGEPLAQRACHTLLTQLCDRNYTVSLETSGARSVAEVDPRVIKIMDLKTPDSGEADKNLWDNLEHLTPQDQVKFVICSHQDYQWYKHILEQHHLLERCQVLISPSHQELNAQTLADWVVADALPVRFQLQLHKYLWGDQPGK